MSRRNPRGLRPDEAELWDKVRQSAIPLHSPSKQVIAKAVRSGPTQTKPLAIDPFHIGQSATATAVQFDLAPSPSEKLTKTPLKMDHKNFQRMKSGKLKPEARIDLHGLTQSQAHPRLVDFIRASHGAGRRLVLVITGKGKVKPDFGPIPVRQGVLRHQVPQWLQSGGLAPLILQVTEAHLKHGGSGAYYVYLRRQR